MTANFVILSDSEKSTPLVILSVSEISTEFKTHFKFKVKNPRFKSANSHFKFVDTSLCYAKFSMTKKRQVSMIRNLSF